MAEGRAASAGPRRLQNQAPTAHPQLRARQRRRPPRVRVIPRRIRRSLHASREARRPRCLLCAAARPRQNRRAAPHARRQVERQPAVQLIRAWLISWCVPCHPAVPRVPAPPPVVGVACVQRPVCMEAGQEGAVRAAGLRAGRAWASAEQGAYENLRMA